MDLLAGIKVLDFTLAAVGPFLGWLLLGRLRELAL